MVEANSSGRRVVLTPEERRARILTFAETLFVKLGHESTKMVAIAQRAGMSKRTHGVIDLKYVPPSVTRSP